MLAAGYTDAEFPACWFSPAREGTEAKTIGQGGTTKEEVDQIEGRRTEMEEGEDYPPTPPKTPTPKEASLTRPTLTPSSDTLPSSSEAFKGLPTPSTSASFSDAEVSLLKDRAITEITPGRWMHTTERADGRIVLTCARDNGTIYLNSEARTTTE